MDIRDILRRLRESQSNRAIARATGVNRKTVGRYRAWTATVGLLKGPLPSLGELHQLLERRVVGPLPYEVVIVVSEVGPGAPLTLDLAGVDPPVGRPPRGPGARPAGRVGRVVGGAVHLCQHCRPLTHPNSGGTRAVRPCNLAWSSVRAETSGLSGTIVTGVTPIRRAW
jgi:hypothetical protein